MPELPYLSRPRSRAAAHRSPVAGDPRSSSFGGDTARCYARYRREYPPEFIEYLRDLPQVPTTLLDLGCGTGQLALQLAPFFERCLGMDPEADMLREAERLALERGVGNVEWIRGSAHDLPRLDLLDLVTIGTAFHFMEPVPTLSALRERIRDDGAVVIAYNGSPMWLHGDPWARALRDVLEEWFGPLSDLDIAVEGIRAAEGALRELGYRDVKRWERVYEDEIDADFVVGHIFSALSPDQVEPSRRPDLAAEIHERLPDETFVERVPVRAVSGRP